MAMKNSSPAAQEWGWEREKALVWTCENATLFICTGMYMPDTCRYMHVGACTCIYRYTCRCRYVHIGACDLG